MYNRRSISPMKTTGNQAQNWKVWRQQFENFLVANEIIKKDESIQCAQLLHLIGDEGLRIYNTFTFTESERNKLAKLMQKFEDHFIPRRSILFERYKFFTRKQNKGETLQDFVAALYEKADTCEFGELRDDLIKTIFVCGLVNSYARQQILEAEEISLQTAIDICVDIEKTEEQTRLISAKFEKQIFNALWRGAPVSNEGRGRSKSVKKKHKSRHKSECS